MIEHSRMLTNICLCVLQLLIPCHEILIPAQCDIAVFLSFYQSINLTLQVLCISSRRCTFNLSAGTQTIIYPCLLMMMIMMVRRVDLLVAGTAVQSGHGSSSRFRVTAYPTEGRQARAMLWNRGSQPGQNILVMPSEDDLTHSPERESKGPVLLDHLFGHLPA